MAHLYVAMPCFGGLLHARTARGLIDLALLLRDGGHALTIDLLSGESLIPRARNRQVASCLKVSAATHLMFIDGDIVFDARDVLRLLDTGHPVVCAGYPVKEFYRPELAKGVAEGLADPLRAATRFAVNAGRGGDFEAVRGCVRVLDAATGFLLIQRHVLEGMIARYPETLYFSDAPQNRGEPHWALFDCAIRDGRYLSEDYLFSRRWQDMGGEVWLDPQIDLGHIGTHEYRGDLLRTFKPIGFEGAPAPVVVSPPCDEKRASVPGLSADGGISEWCDIPALPTSDPQRGWHIYRYQWAAKRIRGTRIANAACGTNYGALVLRGGNPERQVQGYDRSAQALECAAFYQMPTTRVDDLEGHALEGHDCLVALETIEHLKDPWGWLGRLDAGVRELVVSVPVIPTMADNPYHLHDFTKAEVLDGMTNIGWRVLEHQYQAEWRPDSVLLVHAERP